MSNLRERWGNKTGFLLAAIGSAVGLGNIWRFPYVTGDNGGAAFLLIYIVCILLVGLPVLIAEFSLGRRGQSDVIGSFNNTARSKKKTWAIGGAVGIITSFLILSFYGVISGWVMYFMYSYITGPIRNVAEGGVEDYFGGFVSGAFGPLFWQFLFMAFTIAIVFTGVKKGIELSNRICMPVLAVLFVILAGYSLTLSGAGEGMNFLFSPDWSAFGDPRVYSAAVGQAFFSLSLGMGIMITYSSYLPKDTRLPGAAANVAIFDTIVAILAGIVIFPAVFTFGLDPQSGPTLVFITLPEVFNQMGMGGAVFAITFFFLIAIAALTSAISLLEVSVAYFMRRLNWSRKKSAIVAGVAVTLFGIPSALSQGEGVLSDFTIFDLPFLDLLDAITEMYTLPLGGLIVALFVGWGWNRIDALRETHFTDTTIGFIWLWLIRIVAPIGILWILLLNIF